MKIIAERLRALRKSVNLSQANIGKLMGTTQASIQRYEYDRADPTLRILIQYGDYFDVSVDYILGRTDKPQGKLYKYKPKLVEDTPEMRQFIEMCLDPKSPMHNHLKQALFGMLGDKKK